MRWWPSGRRLMNESVESTFNQVINKKDKIKNEGTHE